jgi:hypothetical protein
LERVGSGWEGRSCGLNLQRIPWCTGRKERSGKPGRICSGLCTDVFQTLLDRIVQGYLLLGPVLEQARLVHPIDCNRPRGPCSFTWQPLEVSRRTYSRVHVPQQERSVAALGYGRGERNTTRHARPPWQHAGRKHPAPAHVGFGSTNTRAPLPPCTASSVPREHALRESNSSCSSTRVKRAHHPRTRSSDRNGKEASIYPPHMCPAYPCMCAN